MKKANASKNHVWVWTSKAEQLKPERRAFEPVWKMYQKSCPASWLAKGYVTSIPDEAILTTYGTDGSSLEFTIPLSFAVKQTYELGWNSFKEFTSSYTWDDSEILYEKWKRR